MKTTVGKLLLKEHLPLNFHNFIDTTILDKKGLAKLFNDLVESEKLNYAKITNGLTRLGFEVATRHGSSISLEDLKSPIDKKSLYDEFNKKLEALKSKKISEEEYKKAYFELYNPFIKQLTDATVAEGTRKGNMLSTIVTAGSRGSPGQLRSTISSTGIVLDGNDEPILDIPVINSFAEGLSPGEYLAHTFNARKGMVGTKLSVSESGYVSKQLARATMTLKVEEHDCGTESGIDVSIDDNDYINSYLAKPVGGFNKNTEYTPKVQKDLKSQGIKTVYLRSPMTCHSSQKHHFGAICQLCSGKREKGLPATGSHVGLTAATAAGEVLSQGALNSKHNAGGAAHSHRASGFELINQLANIPGTFKSEAPVSEEDGVVSNIQASPAGGYFINIGDKEYYVPIGEALKVKAGDRVERGQPLSDGVINPSKIVRLLGVGEGRKHYAQALKDAMVASDMNINKRNLDLISRSIIDHVEITDPDGLNGYLPGDVATYSAIEKDYVQRPGTKELRTDKAHNMYLEQPVKHYTIGTRLTQTMIDDLIRSDIQSVKVHTDPPGFEPLMVRLLDVPAHVNDWAHQLNSTYIERRLVHSVNRGSTSSIKGPSPVLGLAYSKDFAKPKETEKNGSNTDDPVLTELKKRMAKK